MDAELHRKKGELLFASARADDAQAEEELCLAITIAREQSAKLLELRAATSLLRIQASRGFGVPATDLLRRLLRWFSNAPEIPDVREARELLAALAGTPFLKSMNCR